MLGGVSGKNLRLLMAGKCDVISLQVCTVGSARTQQIAK